MSSQTVSSVRKNAKELCISPAPWWIQPLDGEPVFMVMPENHSVSSGIRIEKMVINGMVRKDLFLLVTDKALYIGKARNMRFEVGIQIPFNSLQQAILEPSGNFLQIATVKGIDVIGKIEVHFKWKRNTPLLEALRYGNRLCRELAAEIFQLSSS